MKFQHFTLRTQTFNAIFNISNFILLRCDIFVFIPTKANTNNERRRKSITGFYGEDDEESLLCVKMWMKILMKLTLKKLHMFTWKYVHMNKTMLRVVMNFLWSRENPFPLSQIFCHDLYILRSLMMNEKCSQRTLNLCRSGRGAREFHSQLLTERFVHNGNRAQNEWIFFLKATFTVWTTHRWRKTSRKIHKNVVELFCAVAFSLQVVCSDQECK